MEAAAIIAAINAATQLIEVMAPRIEELMRKGEISPEQQAQLMARVQALKSNDAFSGPEWRKSTEA